LAVFDAAFMMILKGWREFTGPKMGLTALAYSSARMAPQ
jgi:hypothetical protein